jgi:monoterpene epsilon-lactone hydrolase
LGRIKVVSVDYRMAPEHTFPASSVDLAVVYESLLGEYEPHNIGIYGSSAGGILTAQSVPRFLEHDLPLPGALGMLGGSGQSLHKGDSAALASYVYDGAAGIPPESDFDVLPYFAGTEFGSRLAAPMLWPDVLAEFPPSLLVTGSRAFEMSSIIDAHNKLTLAGAGSRLHIWDGLGHCFYLDPDLPESREVEAVIVDFFAQALGGERM